MAIDLIVNQASSSKDGLIVTSYEDDYSVQGCKWNVTTVVELTAGASVNFLVDLTNVPSDQAVFTLPVVFSTAESEVTYKAYESTETFNYSGGTVVEPWNPNRRTQKAKNFVITTGATGTDKGLEFVEHIAFGSGQGSNISPASGGSSSPVIGGVGKKYLFEFTNTGSNTTKVEIDGAVFQIPFTS